jgi:hypothetical protein
MLGALAAVLVVEMIGAAVFTLLVSDPARWTMVGKLGLSFGLGLVTLTVLLFVASWCGLKPAWWIGVGEMAVLWAAAAIFRPAQLKMWWPRAPEAVSTGSKPGAHAPRLAETAGRLWVVEVFLGFLVVGLCLVAGAASCAEPVVEWDVTAIWALKGKILLHEPIRTTGYFHDISKSYSHLDYPLLWPLTMSWVWAWTGFNLVTVKVLAPALLCATAATFYGLLRRCMGRLSALTFLALLVGSPMLLSQTSRLMADAPLASFAVVAFVACSLDPWSANRDDLKLASFFAAGMLFTKNEGIGLFAILAILALAGVAWGRQFGRLLPVFLWIVVVPLVLTGAWFLFRMQIPKTHEDYGSRLNPLLFVHNVSHISEIALVLPRYLGDWNDWLAFWPLFGLTLLATPRHVLTPPARFLLMGIVMILLVYGYVYVVTPRPLAELMEVTANRLLLHVFPMCVFLMAEAAHSAGLLPWPSP